MLSENTVKPEFYVGFGNKNLKFFKVQLQPLMKNHIDALTPQYYYPVNFWDGSSVMNKSYAVNDALDLLYDLTNHSSQSYSNDVNRIQSFIHGADY